MTAQWRKESHWMCFIIFLLIWKGIQTSHSKISRPWRVKSLGFVCSPSFFSLPTACRLFSRGVIFTRARVSLALLSLRKNGRLLVVYRHNKNLDITIVGSSCHPQLVRVALTCSRIKHICDWTLDFTVRFWAPGSFQFFLEHSYEFLTLAMWRTSLRVIIKDSWLFTCLLQG